MTTALPELLAPAGTPEALAAVIDAGADSVYVAGKQFGMRQHTAWLNFDEAQLAAAVEFTHGSNRRIYVAVNNLLTNVELDKAEADLDALEVWRPDALIIQDLGLLRRLRQRGTSLELHASCMMNINSPVSAKELGRLGVTRIIASRDITLAAAVRLQTDSGIEFEYFLHGDMCIAQSGQCTTSGIMAGESAGRGRCLKPCRWQWELVDAQGEPVRDGSGLLMARKDLCLIEHIPALVESGIAALKIEGRARTPEHLARIVRAYRRALDTYAADPDGYTTGAELYEELHNHRLRDFGTCLTFGNPGRDGIGEDGAREPRIFSVVIEQPALDADVQIACSQACVGRKLELVVHCGSVAAAEAALAAGANGICVGGERWRQQGKSFTPAELCAVARAVASAKAKLYGTAPRISETDRLADGVLPPPAPDGFDGYYLHTLGQLENARRLGLPAIADLGFNLFNAEAFACVAELGAVRGVASLELSLRQLAPLAAASSFPMEFVIHGPVVGMICEHCLVEAARGCSPRAKESERPPCVEGMVLRDAAGQRHPLLTDGRCRNHVLLPRQLCALSVLGDLLALGPAALRIDGRHETPDVLREIVSVYRATLDRLVEGHAPPQDALQRLARCAPGGLSLCAYDLEVADVATAGDKLPTNEWVRPESTHRRQVPATP